MIRLMAAIAVVLFVVSPVQAKHRKHHHKATKPAQVRLVVDVAARAPYPTASMPGLNATRAIKQGRGGRYSQEAEYASPEASYDEGVIGGRPSECAIRIRGRLIPFCGCAVAVRVFGRPIRELFLAANWRRFPSARPGPGKVAWRWGHVFLIEEDYGDGTVLAYDANSGGGLTRRHRVSLRGYHVVDPRASMAGL